MQQPRFTIQPGFNSATDEHAAKDLQRIQRYRKWTLRLGVVLLLALVCFTRAGFDRSSVWHHVIEVIGMMAIMVCIVGRGWCSLYIGGRKKTELVTSGPYSMCRNPLYVFSFIGAFGAGAQTGSIAIGVVSAALCWAVFRHVVLREEAMLAERFGQAFKRYVNTVPRFRPTWFRWRDEKEISCRPALFLATTRDAMWFWIAIPVLDGVKLLQDHGWLTPVIWLP